MLSMLKQIFSNIVMYIKLGHLNIKIHKKMIIC